MREDSSRLFAVVAGLGDLEDFVELEQAYEFIRKNPRAVLSTYRSDGNAHISPVACGLDDANRVCISVGGGFVKLKNLRRDPRVSVCVFTERFFGTWVHAEGIAEIVEQPEAVELLVDYYRNIHGEHPDWDQYRQMMVSRGQVLVRFEIKRVMGKVMPFGGHPPTATEAELAVR